MHGLASCTRRRKTSPLIPMEKVILRLCSEEPCHLRTVMTHDIPSERVRTDQPLTRSDPRDELHSLPQKQKLSLNKQSIAEYEYLFYQGTFSVMILITRPSNSYAWVYRQHHFSSSHQASLRNPKFEVHNIRPRSQISSTPKRIRVPGSTMCEIGCCCCCCCYCYI